MDDLYRSVFAKVETSSKTWMAEILRWLVIADENLSVMGLHYAVQYAL